jgi:hypothetical protein
MISELDRFWAELEAEEVSEPTQPEAAKPATNQRVERSFRDPQEYRCWHCLGSGQCDCITCGRFETHAVWKAGQCVPCEVRRRERAQ